MTMQKGVVLLAAATLVVNVVQLSWPETHAQDAYAIERAGIVDVQRAIDGYNKHKAGVADLEKQAEGAEARLEFARTELDRMAEKYRQDRPGLTDEERTAREAELEEKRLSIQTQAKQATAQLERDKRILKRELLDDLVAAVDRLGRELDFDLICEADPESRTGVLYHAERIDMTQRVIDRLNQGS